jgi:hypothetical protein
MCCGWLCPYSSRNDWMVSAIAMYAYTRRVWC